MPDVQVTFNTNTHAFTFAPNSGNVTVPKDTTEDIVFQRPSGQSWTFVSFSTDPTSSEFSYTVSSDGSTLTVEDDNQNQTTTTYEYYITINSGGTEYTSDPQIVNRGEQ